MDRISVAAGSWVLLMKLHWLGCTLISALGFSFASYAAKEVPDFALLDFRGRYHHLRQTDAKAVVLFFTANGCPIARQSIPRLRELQEKYEAKGVRVWLVNSNSGDDRKSISKEAQEFHTGALPVLLDETQGVAAMLEVQRTGTAVCIATKSWSIFYRGAIDDQMVEGAQKPAPTEKYLETALEELISIGNKEPISYSRQVAPILRDNCFTCHSPGNIGPIKLTRYEKVQGVADMIQEVVLARRMPPWHADRHHGAFVNDSSISLEQARTLLRWIEQGAKRDDGEDPLLTASAPSKDWVLGKPDAIVSLPKVEEIPATGVLEYRHIQVAAPFDRDVWVKGIVAKPDNTRVVHHIIVRAKEKASDDNFSEDDAFLLGWAPGSPEMFYPAGTGKLIKKGSILDFEMHYTTSGREEKDQSSIGIYLLEDKPEMVLKTRAAYDFEFEVPPGDANRVTFASYGVKRDSMLFDMSPHMHLRGNWFKYEALYPNGKRETLLSVPKYDFKWQHNYRLKEPKRLPAGTWILCSGGFDNSDRNPANPNPGATIRWGDQSFDEMFIGFMGIAEIPKAADRKLASGK
jgi:peroxiredoxin